MSLPEYTNSVFITLDTSTDCSKKRKFEEMESSDNSLEANGDLQSHVDEEEDAHSKPKQVENKDKEAAQKKESSKL